ncbi:MAG TPA: protein kinase [Polyangium sp.]|nr:protein kinase [Polyangium sp.]
MPPTPFDQLEQGTLFHGRYRIGRRIGAGAMGAVYEVVDETTQSLRALKVMQPALVREAVHRERFAQEAKITGKIESDHIVRVLDAGIEPSTGMPFLTMDLLRGETLARELERRVVLPAVDVKRYLQQISFALTKTHAAGIVHRDLKPENLFVTTRDDGSPCLKILDFGIAKVVAGTNQAKATRVGTPLYMAPEQLEGRGTVGPQTDVHALAHIAYELLVGEAYWEEESRSQEGLVPFFQTLAAGPVELPSVRALRRRSLKLPANFDPWFLRAVARKPQDRFASTNEFVQAFDRVCDNRKNFGEITIAAGPLVQALQAPPPIDSDEVKTVVRPVKHPVPEVSNTADRNFDAATTIPRPLKRLNRQMQGAIVGVVVAGIALLVVIVWKARSTKQAENVVEAAPGMSVSSPAMADPVPVAVKDAARAVDSVMVESAAVPSATSPPTSAPTTTAAPHSTGGRHVSSSLGPTSQPTTPKPKSTSKIKRPGVPY